METILYFLILSQGFLFPVHRGTIVHTNNNNNRLYLKKVLQKPV